MSAPNIVLGKGYVLLHQTLSTLNIAPISPLLIGVVDKVYSTSDRVAVSQSVLFDSSKAQKILYGSTQYYLINEDFIQGNEVIIP